MVCRQLRINFLRGRSRREGTFLSSFHVLKTIAFAAISAQKIKSGAAGGRQIRSGGESKRCNASRHTSWSWGGRKEGRKVLDWGGWESFFRARGRERKGKFKDGITNRVPFHSTWISPPFFCTMSRDATRMPRLLLIRLSKEGLRNWIAKNARNQDFLPCLPQMHTTETNFLYKYK